MMRLLGSMTLFVVLLTVSRQVDAAPFQTVSGDTSSIFAAPGDGISFKVQYDTSDTDNTLTGLGLRMHFDSSFMTFALPGDLFATSKVQEQLQDDAGDLDSDPNTDKFFLTAWLDILGTWPGVALPLDLYTAAFTLDAGLSSGQSTTVRFTDSSTAASHDFLGSNVVVTAVPVTAVPEPATIVLFLTTAACVLGYGCRRRRCMR